MADGRVTGSPQYSVEDAEAAIASRPTGLESYASMFAAPAVADGLTTRPVQTYAVDEYGSPILNKPSPFAAAEKALELRGDATSKTGAQARIAYALSAIPHANGTLVADKSQDRLTPNQFGYGENGVTGNEAVRVAEALASQSNLIQRGTGPSGRGPGRPPIRGLPLTQTDWTVANQGMGGITRDPRIGNNAQGRALNITAPQNKTQAALAQVKAAAAPRVNAAPAVAAQQAQGLSPSQAYAAANEAARQTAIANSSNPSANSARASLASQWGFD